MQQGCARILSLGQPGKSNHGFAFINVQGGASTACRQHILESAFLVTFQTWCENKAQKCPLDIQTKEGTAY